MQITKGYKYKKYKFILLVNLQKSTQTNHFCIYTIFFCKKNDNIATIGVAAIPA